jgi:NAD(P)-dependent dehydrogenase (short-subunit alcohol dehydrogenase family)
MKPDVLSLADRVAVVTGGGSGLGRGIAKVLSDYGARVAIWERDSSTAQSTGEAIGALACAVDVRDEAQVDLALTSTIDELGVPTILINNAGGTFWSEILDTSVKGWDTVIRTNLTQVLICTARVTRRMIADRLTGNVVNITSIEGVRAAPGYAAYAAAKAGVINFTKTAALELAPYNIRVNGIAPDATLTEALTRMASPEFADQAAKMVPLGRLGRIDEIASATMFLVSDMSSYITGQTLHVDGGTSAAAGWHHGSNGQYVLGTVSSHQVPREGRGNP